MDDIQSEIADYEAETREFEGDPEYELEDIAVRLLRPEPGVGPAGSIAVVEAVDSVRAKPSWGGDFVKLAAEYYLYATEYDENDEAYSATADPEGQSRVEDVDGQWRNYEEEPYDKVRWTFAPPLLVGEGVKVQRDWFYQFLLEPYPLRQQLRVHMPTFHWAEGEAGAIADYFAGAAQKDWPSLFTRHYLLERGIDPAPEKDDDEGGLGALSMAIALAGDGSISPDQIRDILEGDPVSTAANFGKLEAFAVEGGFTIWPAVDPQYEAVDPRLPRALETLAAENPNYFADVHRLAVEGPNCVQCHFLQGAAPNAEGPIAWAPDLDNVRARLRPDWVREWLTDPGKIYPGTAMPANFPLDQSQWQEFWPGTSEEQIEAVTNWLFNLDRWSMKN